MALRIRQSPGYPSNIPCQAPGVVMIIVARVAQTGESRHQTKLSRADLLRRHIVDIDEPTLAYIGLPSMVIPFPMFQYQANWLARCALIGSCFFFA
jgi:hypothetical protein